MFFLVKCSLHMLSFLWKAADVLLRVSRWKNKLKHHRFDRKKECTEPMKDEYERLLFGEDDAETVEPEAAEEAPAEDAAE